MNSSPKDSPRTEESKPEWIRPKQVYKIFGIGRSRLYELLAEGKIKTVSLRQRGQKHGTRLISYDSLISYLDELVQTRESQTGSLV